MTDIPLTIIGGFLGAGKTTLLNRLLQEPGGRRLAVLVNDFGTIDIDRELVQSRDADTISLANGCICCGMSGEFLFALAGLRDRENPPEHVVVEASGIADPATIADYAEMPGFRRDASIVVADAETVRTLAADVRTRPEVVGQLRAAHLIVLNKTDLVSSEALAETRAWMAETFPFATIVDAAFGDVPTPFLLGAGDATPRRAPAGEHVHPGHEPDRFSAWSWAGEPALHGQALCESLVALPDGVVRAKGLLHLREDVEHRYVLQLVGRRWFIKRDRPWGDEPPGSRVVVIGLPESIRADELEATMVRLSAPAPAG